MSKEKTAKERVQEVYPDAVCLYYTKNARKGWFVFENNTCVSVHIGVSDTEQGAWEDALKNIQTIIYTTKPKAMIDYEQEVKKVKRKSFYTSYFGQHTVWSDELSFNPPEMIATGTSKDKAWQSAYEHLVKQGKIS